MYLRKIYKLVIGTAIFAPLLLLTACIPSGNVVGSADFIPWTDSQSIYPYRIANGEILHLEVNGGTVVTPKGLRFRITKAEFSMPSQGIKFQANKVNQIEPYDFSSSVPFNFNLENSKVNSRNTCALFSGQFENGIYFAAAISDISPTDRRKLLTIYTFRDHIGLVPAGLVGIFQGAIFNSSTDKLQIGGKNLCG